MVKRFTFLVTGALLLLCTYAWAQQPTFTLSPATNTVTVGQTFTVNVSVSNFTNIASTQYAIGWNAAVVEFVSVSNINGTALPGFTTSNLGTPGTGNVPNNRIFVSWNEPNFNGVNVSGGTILFTITLRGIAAGNSNIAFNTDPPGIEVLNGSFVNVGMTQQNATATVTGTGGGGGGGNNLVVAIADVNGQTGQQVCMDVTVQNFTNILGMQFSFNYDPTKLQFAQVSNLNLAGLAAANFGNPAPGAVTMTWNDPNVVGLSVANGTAIFSICFNVIGTTNATVTITGNPTPIEVIDGTNAEIGLTTDSGVVTLGGGGGGGGGNCSFSGFGLIMEDVNGTTGQQVCMDVTTQGFTNILGMQFSINYDPNVLQFAEVKNFNLAGLVAASFGNPAPGAITMTWNDPNVVGLSVGDDTAIFTICFNVIGSANTTVTFTGSPTPVEITDGNENPVTFNNCSGTVTLDGGTGPTCGDGIMNGQETGVDCGGPDCEPCNTGGTGGTGCPSPGCNINGFGLVLEDYNATAGQQICVNVYTKNFTNILGMQFSINYDPNVLQFVQATNFNLDGLFAASFGNPAPGAITFTWTDPNVTGLNVADCEAIFTLCFNPIASTTTTISFSGSPTPVEITDGNEQSVAFSSCSSTVTFGGSQPTCGDGIMNGQETGVDCGGPDCEPCQTDPSGCPSADCNLPANAFGLILEDMNTETGQQVCIDVYSHNFTNILGMQFSINYDLNVLQFVQATNFTLPGLAGANFGNPAPGAITFTWTDPNVTGYTVTDCTPLFTLCFNVIGGNNTQSLVTFSNSPTPVEITDGNEQNVAFNSCSSTLCIGNCGGGSNQAPQVSGTVTNVKCKGESSGSVMLLVIGNGPYTFQWGGVAASNGNVPTATGLGVGTATVTVTDMGAGGLSTTKTFMITEPTSAVTALVTNQVNVFCPSDPNGSITITPAGGTPPYTADWCCSLPDNVFTQSGLSAGTYSVTVADANGCTKVLSNINIQSQNNPLVINMTPVPIPQGGGGAINVNASGGTGTLAYSWSGPNNFSSTSEDISGLNTPGDYCLTVTDASGCTAEKCVFLPRELVITNFIITKPCPGATNGSIDLTIQGGVEPITYKWTKMGQAGTIGTTQDIPNLGSGTYFVMVSDASGQQITGTFEVTVNNLVITPTIIPSPNGNDGSIGLSIQGGNAGYTFAWSPNAGSGASITGLAPGQYCVTITYQSVCSFEACYNVPGQALGLAISGQTPVDCFGDDNGTVTVNIAGGTGPYTVEIGENSYPFNAAGNYTITDVPAGTYDIVLSDSQGGQVTKSVTISEPAPIAVDVIVVHDTEDPGCTGNITLGITGGTPTYSVGWNAPIMGPQVVVCAGNYNAVITDSHGCQVTLPNIVVNTFSESAVIEDNDCEDDQTGSITLNLTGGNTPYTVKWRESENGPVIAQGVSLPNLGAGTYYAEITEASGNILHRSYTIDIASNLRVETGATTDYNGYAVSCAAAADGVLKATAMGQAGTATYEWLLNGSVVGMDATLNNVAPGLYTIRVFDNDCTIERQIEVSAPPALTVDALNIKPTECKGERNGEIVVQAAGGVTVQPYIYRWDNNDFGPVADLLPSGEHTVSVTDGNGCEIVQSFTVPEPEVLQVTVETEPATEKDCNGTARAVVTGGNPPYNYNWLTQNNAATAIITGLCPGEYEVEVTDFNGCQGKTGKGTVEDKRFPCLEERVVITPDGNGSNDEFIIFCIGELVDNHLEIYNRWGQLVFETDDYDNTWEGTSQNGEPLPEGPYYYILEYRGPDNELIQVKGSISLLRD